VIKKRGPNLKDEKTKERWNWKWFSNWNNVFKFKNYNQEKRDYISRENKLKG